MVVRPSIRNALIAAVAATVLIVGISAFALSGNQGKHTVAAPQSSTSTTSPSASPSATAAPTPTPKPAPAPKPAAVNPLTGVGPPPTGPVIAVKIDDTFDGRPSVGLEKADIVYIEQAEGGLTRLVGVFGSSRPVVEPVRSVRASDPELLSQYGGIALVASGGGGDSLPTLDASPVRGVINDRGAPGFFRDGSRPVPYNLGVDLARVAAVTMTAGSRDVGFQWSQTDARLGRAASADQVNTVVGSTPVTFVWDAASHRYLRTIAGQVLRTAVGVPAAAPNVLVQLCQVTTNQADIDVTGHPSQYTHSVGTGRVALFRDGHRIDGRWSRVSAGAPTRFVDLAGHPLTLAPGGAYVVLASTGAPV